MLINNSSDKRETNLINKPILFFDGMCGLCDSSVDFLIKIDKKNKILFAPLQGATASDILDIKFIEDLNSLAFYQNEITYSKSTAILQSLKTIGGAWKFFYIFIFIPPFIRDAVYNFIASIRYKFFGKLEQCRIPTLDERNKILK